MIHLDEVLLIHKIGIKRYGGSDGLRDESALLSANQRPFQTFDGEDLYPDLIGKCAALIKSIVVNHPFVDGNKRTGYTVMRTFLRVNKLDMKLLRMKNTISSSQFRPVKYAMKK